MDINIYVGIDRQNGFNFGNLPVGGAALTIENSKKVKDGADLSVLTADAHEPKHESYAETHGKAAELQFADVELPGVGKKSIPVGFPLIELARDNQPPLTSLGWTVHCNWKPDFSGLSDDGQFVDGLISPTEKKRLQPTNPLNLVVYDDTSATVAAYKGLTEECFGVEASFRNNPTVVRDYFNDHLIASAYEAARQSNHSHEPNLTINLDYDGDAITHCVYDSVKQRLSQRKMLEEKYPGLKLNINVIRENVNAIPLPLSFIMRENGDGERNVPLTAAEQSAFQQQMDSGQKTLADVNKQICLEELEKMGAHIVSLNDVLARQAASVKQTDRPREEVIEAIRDASAQFAFQNKSEAEQAWPEHPLNRTRLGNVPSGNLAVKGGHVKEKRMGG